MPVKIKPEIIDILKQCTVAENYNLVFLPNIQLERKTYAAVNKCLEQIGGKWNRNQKGHLFESDPESIFADMLETGEYIDIKKEYQFFETPQEITSQLVEIACIEEGNKVLEPSAGQGAILDHIPVIYDTYWVELNRDNCKILNERFRNSTTNFWHMNFLDFYCDEDTPKFDRIIMNPPFRNQQDIDHFTHAFDNCLTDSGIIVSIISESPFFRETKKAKAFRELLYGNDTEIIELDSGAFKDSGTMVKTRIVKIVK